MAASTVILKQKGIVLQITTDYTGIGKIQYIAGERSLPILDSEYTDRSSFETSGSRTGNRKCREGNYRRDERTGTALSRMENATIL